MLGNIRALREVAGALGRNQVEAAAIGHQAASQPERVRDHPRVQHVLDGDQRLEGGAGFLAAHSRCTTEIIANCSRFRP